MKRIFYGLQNPRALKVGRPRLDWNLRVLILRGTRRGGWSRNDFSFLFSCERERRKRKEEKNHPAHATPIFFLILLSLLSLLATMQRKKKTVEENERWDGGLGVCLIEQGDPQKNIE